MKSILGIGNALTDILAVLPDDSLLRRFHLPLGSMQHVDMETGDRIWEALKADGVKGMFAVQTPFKGYVASVETRANADGTTTLLAVVKYGGLTITIR